MLDIEFVFGNDAAIGGTGHGGKHGGEAGVAAEDFEDHEALVGAGGGAQAVDHLDGARDARAEADTVVGAGDVIVHGLGNANDLEAFLVEANAVAEGVVAADGDKRVDAEPGEILEDFGSEVVLFGGEFVLEMPRGRWIWRRGRDWCGMNGEKCRRCGLRDRRSLIEEKKVVRVS